MEKFRIRTHAGANGRLDAYEIEADGFTVGPEWLVLHTGTTERGITKIAAFTTPTVHSIQKKELVASTD